MDRNVTSLKPMKPPPLENTPFKLIEEVKDLKELATKLRSVNEFAVRTLILSLAFVEIYALLSLHILSLFFCFCFSPGGGWVGSAKILLC